ncbi:ribonuclease D [Spirulina sp. CCNP1310]|uniref:ribonuclease D n=1 Tax=Spirulina sp. CCNP1310 TaxID=3110249 RepID=UPI002B20BB28|nr:ribonuclease D [Spirulina sp. CCNP1310]MEA5418625.1 ribonuclease D [Spirulina sp. CCNP1310]
MQYLTHAGKIREAIAHLARFPILWLDTETAAYRSKNRRIALIQAQTDPGGDAAQVFLLDVLDQPDLIETFITTIIANPQIEKVFHNASYDLRFLDKTRAENITCTLKIAKAIPPSLLPVDNHKLNTLAAHLCNLSLDKTEQGGDWGQRPLTTAQKEYAALDVIVLPQIHQALLKRQAQAPSLSRDPAQEDLDALTLAYRQISLKYEAVKAEYESIKDRLKQAMAAQQSTHCNGVRYQKTTTTEYKISFADLLAITQTHQLPPPNLPIKLTQEWQKSLKPVWDLLPIEESLRESISLKIAKDEEDVPF